MAHNVISRISAQSDSGNERVLPTGMIDSLRDPNGCHPLKPRGPRIKAAYHKHESSPERLPADMHQTQGAFFPQQVEGHLTTSLPPDFGLCGPRSSRESETLQSVDPKHGSIKSFGPVAATAGARGCPRPRF
jgi:hypothetical protein